MGSPRDPLAHIIKQSYKMSFTMSAKSCRTLPRATLGSKQTCNTLRARATPPAAKRQFTVQAGISVGDKAPDFTLPDQNGKSVKLSKYQGIFGKKVVLYFYGSDGKSKSWN